MNITTIGIDLAKEVFQVYGVDEKGRKVFSKKLKRGELFGFMAQQPACLVGMEACGSAHYWAREFRQMGHTVKLMAPQYVKPYVKTNKNDEKDAEAICEAVGRPNMRFVEIKTLEQQDILLVHRIRSRLVAESTALQNQIRGLLAEYGIVMRKGKKNLVNGLPEILADDPRLSEKGRELLTELLDELKNLQERIKKQDRHISELVKADDRCRRLKTIPGIGPITASALVGTIGSGKQFEKGRQLSAFLGLTPKQSSSGGKDRLLGISKRGDRYLRTLMIHGARAAVKAVLSSKEEKMDRLSCWIRALKTRAHNNVVVVALANKNARIAWAILNSGQTYDGSTMNIDDFEEEMTLEA